MALADRTWAHMALGAALMGAWAGFANRGHAMPVPVQAALVQAVLTAGITFVMKRVLEGLSARLPGRAALFGPPIAAGALSLGLLSLFHTLSGTPELLHTIALPFCVASLYGALYTFRLWRHR